MSFLHTPVGGGDSVLESCQQAISARCEACTDPPDPQCCCWLGFQEPGADPWRGADGCWLGGAPKVMLGCVAGLPRCLMADPVSGTGAACHNRVARRRGAFFPRRFVTWTSFPQSSSDWAPSVGDQLLRLIGADGCACSRARAGAARSSDSSWRVFGATVGPCWRNQ